MRGEACIRPMQKNCMFADYMRKALSEYCGIEQLEACQPHKLEVTGSSPVPAPKEIDYFDISSNSS